MRMFTLAITGLFLAAAQTGHAQDEDELEMGLIGLDTSHVIAFTNIFNDPDHADHVPGGRVVAAYQGGSDDLPSSYERVEGYTEQLVEDWDVEVYDTIEELCEAVDVILLTSVDGRKHLEQAIPVYEAGLPLFIDKPLAASLEDAVELVDLANEHGVPMYSGSSLRFRESVMEFDALDVGELRGADTTGPCSIDPTHPDLFWYGVHGVETLFTLMGPDCVEVTRVHTGDTDLVVGRWADGSVGTFRGIRNAAAPFRGVKYGADDVASATLGGGYKGQAEAIIEFFRTGESPVSDEEMLAVFAFMEAAEESKRRDGAPVRLDEVLEEARN
ncbi:MAG: Gfo/Idh/MocA family protein [Candidatus Hydrogenedentota bacterium]